MFRRADVALAACSGDILTSVKDLLRENSLFVWLQAPSRGAAAVVTSKAKTMEQRGRVNCAIT